MKITKCSFLLLMIVWSLIGCSEQSKKDIGAEKEKVNVVEAESENTDNDSGTGEEVDGPLNETKIIVDDYWTVVSENSQTVEWEGAVYTVEKMMLTDKYPVIKQGKEATTNAIGAIIKVENKKENRIIDSSFGTAPLETNNGIKLRSSEKTDSEKGFVALKTGEKDTLKVVWLLNETPIDGIDSVHYTWSTAWKNSDGKGNIQMHEINYKFK